MSMALLTFRRLAFSALMLTASAAHAQLHIEITGVSSTQIPVATAQFAQDSAVPEDVPQIVRNDLQNSGLIRNIDAGQAVLADNATVDYNEWKTRGADAVVVGSVNHLAGDRFDVRFRLYDTARHTDLGGLQLTASAATLRLTGHKISDYVFEKLTGVKGAFSTRIAYVIRLSQQRYELQIADYDGGNPQVALASREPIISPSWSPDGSRLAYVSFEQRKPVIYVHTIATGQRVPVANFKGSNSAPAWSPDGRTLALTLSRDGNSQVYLMNADGSGLRRFTQSGGIDTEPFFAPDGQSVYFTSDRGGSPQIYRASVTGGGVTRVTFKGDYNISPRVSPDGKSLAFVSRRSGRFEVFLLDLSSGQEVQLTDTVKDESPSFAPNGKIILYATEVGGRGVLAAASTDGSFRQRIPLKQSGDVREPAWGPFVH